MKIIPVINCPDFDCVKSRIEIAESFLCDHGSESRVGNTDENCWIHIDIADGGFTNGYTTWRNPEDLPSLQKDSHLKIEVHLMLTEPELALESWLNAGVSRIIVHIETVTAIDTVAAICEGRGVEVWLALSPETPAEKVFPYLPLVKGCQVLAVHPGLAGQTTEPNTYEKIRAIRREFPLIPIEVDGGVTPETVPLYREAGATQVVAGSVIFGADDSVAMYRKLSALAE